jgi:hypothetical protein
MLRRFHGIQQREHARIGRGIAKPRQWALNQSWYDTAIKARNAAVGVQGAHGHRKGRAGAVLVIHLIHTDRIYRRTAKKQHHETNQTSRYSEKDWYGLKVEQDEQK